MRCYKNGVERECTPKQYERKWKPLGFKEIRAKKAPDKKEK